MVRTAALLAGLVLFLYLFLHLGPGRILGLLLSIGWNFPLVVAIFAGYQLVRTVALSQCILGRSGFSYWNLLWIRISGEAIQFLSFTGPFLGEPAKAWLLQKRGMRTREAFAAVLAEYLIYTFASAGLSIAGLSYLVAHFKLTRAVHAAAVVIIWATSVFLAVSAWAIVSRFYLIGAIIKSASALPLLRNRFRPNMEDINRMEDLLLIVLRDRPLKFLSILILEMLAHGLLIFEIFWILYAMNLPGTMLQAFLIEASTKFTSVAFFFIPAQLGAVEGTTVVIFKTLGLPIAAGLSLSLVQRLRSLILAAAGLITMWRLSGS
ncbi:MAG TPA: lysylphosphatidylglycerol synthase domain-containing protein [Acidobacteriota bacterium]|jgi:hypothetical protein|nr:lysylphosphatidylglycerol synthase domain-containing protein [Acidobacteriota bacterium]